MKKTYQCEICEAEGFKRKSVRIINNIIYCKKCYSKKRKEHRKETKKTIPEKPRPKKYNVKPKPKKIEPIKKKKKKVITSYITFDEKRLLFRNLIKQGYDEFEAKDRIRELLDYQNELARKMRKQNKTEEQINKKFKEEFNKLIMGIE